MTRAPKPDEHRDDGDGSAMRGNGILGGPAIFIVGGIVLLLAVVAIGAAFSGALSAG